MTGLLSQVTGLWSKERGLWSQLHIRTAESGKVQVVVVSGDRPAVLNNRTVQSSD